MQTEGMSIRTLPSSQQHLGPLRLHGCSRQMIVAGTTPALHEHAITKTWCIGAQPQLLVTPCPMRRRSCSRQSAASNHVQTVQDLLFVAAHCQGSP